MLITSHLAALRAAKKIWQLVVMFFDSDQFHLDAKARAQQTSAADRKQGSHSTQR